MTQPEQILLPTRKLDPDIVRRLRELVPGQKLEIVQTVRVGAKVWTTTVRGTFRSINYLATGISTDRVPADDIVMPMVHFTKENGELTSIALDENTQVVTLFARERVRMAWQADWYRLRPGQEPLTPALAFYPAIIAHNINAAIALVGGDPSRLRPHAKTHKCPQVIEMQVRAGVLKHKCATVAEAEMIARAGGNVDVLIGYPLVGPHIPRLGALMRAYPEARFSCVVDDAGVASEMSAYFQAQGLEAEVWLDVDVGMARTGVPWGRVPEVARHLEMLPALSLRGLHLYDGHLHHDAIAERAWEVASVVEALRPVRRQFEAEFGRPLEVVAGGTPTFPAWAALNEPGVDCSPGTYVLHDANYGARYADLADFRPAAVLFTRVISRPAPNRLTLDLGHKAVAGDQPAGKRLVLVDLPDAVAVMHSEEHLVLETPYADSYRPGDLLIAVPAHVCPCCNLHREALTVEDGVVTGAWPLVGRDRHLGC